MQPAASGLDGAGVKLMKGEAVASEGRVNEQRFLKKRVEDVPVDQVISSFLQNSLRTDSVSCSCSSTHSSPGNKRGKRPKPTEGTKQLMTKTTAARMALTNLTTVKMQKMETKARRWI